MMKNEKKEKKRKRDHLILCVIFVLSVALIAAAIIWCVLRVGQDGTESAQSKVTEVSEPLPFSIPGFVRIDEVELQPVGGQLQVTAVGRFTGPYVEDGTDEEVTDVLALIVENTGESWVEYAELTMDCGGETARFVLSSLPSGSSALVMETNRMTYAAGTDYRLSEKAKIAELTSAVMDFSEEFMLYPDDGVINLENISGKDHAESVSVYYKNYRYGLYYGGICYRARFEDGIAAGELAQSVQTHYSNADSVIMYMSYEK